MGFFTGCSMLMHRLSDPAVKAAFAAYPQQIRLPLEELRGMILETAAAIPGIGPIEESLKWGQPSYAPIKPGLGTAVRIGPVPDTREDYALYVHCQTTLVETFRNLYRDRLRFMGSRAMVFTAGEIPPAAPVKHFIALALTYYMREVDPASTSAARRSARLGGVRCTVSA